MADPDDDEFFRAAIAASLLDDKVRERLDGVDDPEARADIERAMRMSSPTPTYKLPDNDSDYEDMPILVNADDDNTPTTPTTQTAEQDEEEEKSYQEAVESPETQERQKNAEEIQEQVGLAEAPDPPLPWIKVWVKEMAMVQYKRPNLTELRFSVDEAEDYEVSQAVVAPSPWKSKWCKETDRVVYRHDERNEEVTTIALVIQADDTHREKMIASKVERAEAAPIGWTKHWNRNMERVEYHCETIKATVNNVGEARYVDSALKSAPNVTHPWIKSWNVKDKKVSYIHSHNTHLCVSTTEEIELIAGTADVHDPWMKMWDPEYSMVYYVHPDNPTDKKYSIDEAQLQDMNNMPKIHPPWEIVFDSKQVCYSHPQRNQKASSIDEAITMDMGAAENAPYPGWVKKWDANNHVVSYDNPAYCTGAVPNLAAVTFIETDITAMPTVHTPWVKLWDDRRGIAKYHHPITKRDAYTPQQALEMDKPNPPLLHIDCVVCGKRTAIADVSFLDPKRAYGACYECTNEKDTQRRKGYHPIMFDVFIGPVSDSVVKSVQDNSRSVLECINLRVLFEGVVTPSGHHPDPTEWWQNAFDRWNQLQTCAVETSPEKREGMLGYVMHVLCRELGKPKNLKAKPGAINNLDHVIMKALQCYGDKDVVLDDTSLFMFDDLFSSAVKYGLKNVLGLFSKGSFSTGSWQRFIDERGDNPTTTGPTWSEISILYMQVGNNAPLTLKSSLFSTHNKQTHNRKEQSTSLSVTDACNLFNVGATFERDFKFSTSQVKDLLLDSMPQQLQHQQLQHQQSQHQQSQHQQSQRDVLAKLAKKGVVDLETQAYDGSRSMFQLAAAAHRDDVLLWLCDDYRVDEEVKDSVGATALAIARAANNNGTHDKTIEWIQKRRSAKIINKFVARHFRGRQVREKHADICRFLNLGKKFRLRWDNVLKMVQAKETIKLESWTTIKQQKYDLARDGFDEDEEDTHGILDVAAQSAALETVGTDDADYDDDVDVVGDDDNDNDHDNNDNDARVGGDLVRPDVNKIQLTDATVKWVKKADAKFAALFFRRIEQLAAGDQSRILKKHLTGCKTPIWETYLEQKSGHRILWTTCIEPGDPPTPLILVWCVARHKQVSRYIALIDDADSRSHRRLMPVSSVLDNNNINNNQVVDEALELDANQVLLDPFGNTPLKLHQINRSELKDIKAMALTSWKPPLRLTQDERACVERQGTVLLLGRSGTGKTICICNRMDFDRRAAQGDNTFKQLFVARSQRVCTYVNKVVDVHDTSRFLMFDNLIIECEKGLADAAHVAPVWYPNRKVTFQRFKAEFYLPNVKDQTLDALVVWTQIRSFIQNEIKAVVNLKALSREDYYVLGEKRCSLDPKQREIAYTTFEQYSRWIESNKYWDDCKRVLSLLSKFKSATPEQLHTLQHSKVYVDEIQDYTQAEIALIYALCSVPDGLFLAGDTAQSVVEGVTFRFDEVRSVAYHLAPNHMPEKPLMVYKNFRSHSGVLDVAAAVLNRLFTAFPDGADKLPPDEGVFLGPRPGLLGELDENGLLTLLSHNPGLVVLTHDDHVSTMKEMCGASAVVLGIREAKGLEFDDVVLVNFFTHMTDENRKLWGKLFTLTQQAGMEAGFPELEAQVKLLYTGITRCCNRLFIAECAPKQVGDKFRRWLLNREKPLAVLMDAKNGRIAKTPDEWTAQGVSLGMLAEDVDVEADDAADKTVRFLEQAILCFERGSKHVKLLEKAEIHKSNAAVRRKLETMKKMKMDKLTPELEIEIPYVVEKCVQHGLLSEAVQLCNTVAPFLDVYLQQTFERDLRFQLEQLKIKLEAEQVET